MIKTKTENQVMQITLDRPTKKNALDLAHYRALTKGLLSGDQNPAVSVLLLQGAGEDFTAGNDIQDFLNHPPKDENSPVL